MYIVFYSSLPTGRTALHSKMFVIIIIKMCSFILAKVTPMSPVNHGETLANDLKIQIFTFYIKLGVLRNLRQFIPYTTKLQDSKLIKTSVWNIPTHGQKHVWPHWSNLALHSPIEMQSRRRLTYLSHVTWHQIIAKEFSFMFLSIISMFADYTQHWGCTESIETLLKLFSSEVAKVTRNG